MGYRNYIASITKEEYDKIKDFTKKELYEYKNEDIEDGCVGVCDMAEKELYGFGKYCEFGDEKFYKPFFMNKDLQENFTAEQDFYIVGKDFLKHIIEHNNEKMKFLYTELISGITDENISNIPQKKAEELFNWVRGNAIEWTHLTPYNLDEGDEITTSWNYEYSIFELVRIYKSFDWKNNIMFYYGY